MRHRYYLRRYAVVLIVFVLSGCQSGNKTINPGTGQVDLRVWVVPAQGDIFGFDDNVGCRLDMSQISARIQRIQSSSPLFGANTTFAWDGVVTQITDQQIPFDRTTQAQNINFWTSPNFLLWQNGFYDPSKINIYFTGNVQSDGNPTGGINAATLEPFPGSFSASGVPAFVFINDGGFNQFSGFLITPAAMTSRNIIEHEMTHYLGRFTNRTFGASTNARTYNAEEHVPQGSNNILTPFTPPPHPFVLHGTKTAVGTEKNEVWNRIISGNWNNP